MKKKVFCGSEMDRMPAWAFRVMSFMFQISDRVKSPAGKLDPFHIKKGQTVIDWGSGTGRFLRQASDLVGDEGTVYAVDIHELAVNAAGKQAEKYRLKNVKPVLTDGRSVEIPSHSVDIIYALDMFHMVSQPEVFLRELHRLLKPDGTLFLEDGHQPRAGTKEKVRQSGKWDIVSESDDFICCRPIA
jgi:ubiquinone/menaquinone biosynthesis C-methylase UbiE